MAIGLLTCAMGCSWSGKIKASKVVPSRNTISQIPSSQTVLAVTKPVQILKPVSNTKKQGGISSVQKKSFSPVSSSPLVISNHEVAEVGKKDIVREKTASVTKESIAKKTITPSVETSIVSEKKIVSVEKSVSEPIVSSESVSKPLVMVPFEKTANTSPLVFVPFQTTLDSSLASNSNTAERWLSEKMELKEKLSVLQDQLAKTQKELEAKNFSVRRAESALAATNTKLAEVQKISKQSRLSGLVVLVGCIFGFFLLTVVYRQWRENQKLEQTIDQRESQAKKDAAELVRISQEKCDILRLKRNLQTENGKLRGELLELDSQIQTIKETLSGVAMEFVLHPEDMEKLGIKLVSDTTIWLSQSSGGLAFTPCRAVSLKKPNLLGHINKCDRCREILMAKFSPIETSFESNSEKGNGNEDESDRESLMDALDAALSDH